MACFLSSICKGRFSDCWTSLTFIRYEVKKRKIKDGRDRSRVTVNRNGCLHLMCCWDIQPNLLIPMSLSGAKLHLCTPYRHTSRFLPLTSLGHSLKPSKNHGNCSSRSSHQEQLSIHIGGILFMWLWSFSLLQLFMSTSWSHTASLPLLNTALAWLWRSSNLTAHFSTTVSFSPVEAHQVVITYLGLFLQMIFT